MDIHLLYELQQQEINLQKLLQRLEKLKSDDYLKRLRQEYLNLKQQYLDLIEKKDREDKLCESKKRSIIKLVESKETYENLKYSPEINNAKKLKIIEKQIEDAENNIKREKKMAQDINERIIEINNEISNVKKKIIFIKNKYESTRESNQRELEFLEKEKFNIEELTKDIKEQIDENSMNEYLKMKKRYDNPISVIESRKCCGCSVDVPSMNYESAKTGNIIKCESCGRILFYKKGK